MNRFRQQYDREMARARDMSDPEVAIEDARDEWNENPPDEERVYFTTRSAYVAEKDAYGDWVVLGPDREVIAKYHRGTLWVDGASSEMLARNKAAYLNGEPPLFQGFEP